MLKPQQELFSLPERIHYLNCAYMSPLMKSVEKAGIEGLLRKRNPIAISPDDFFEESEELRKAFSRLINNPEPERIAIIPSASYGMANIAKNVKFNKDDHIMVIGYQFPSNYYPWKQLADETGVELKTIYPPEDLEFRGRRWNDLILESINENTRLIAMPHVHWADGTRFNLKAIREKVKKHEGLLIVDGTQSVGALPFDIQEIQPDALICAGYKWLMGPYSIGVAYYGKCFDGGIPVEHNWINRKNSRDFSNLVNYQMDYEPGALRYEVGEHSNFILVPMLLEAVRQIERWGVDNIQEYCGSIVKDAIIELRSAGFSIEDEGYRGNHLFGIYLPGGMRTSVVKQALEEKRVYVSTRGASVRVSPHLYNTVEDIEALVQVLKGLV
jgi:selenocysteine lyase/cysteine desulfurase